MGRRMSETAHLVLADGTVFSGASAGARVFGFGEVVFNTSMTGYQEILTDPSYAGQIVVMTFPLIGNYGILDESMESARVQAAGLVVREDCWTPSHWKGRGTIRDYLMTAGVPCLAGVDTRALTRRLRSAGVMMGAIGVGCAPEDTMAHLRGMPDYADLDLVHQVSSTSRYEWPREEPPRGRIAIVDTGVKYNILRLLSKKGYQGFVLPCDVDEADVLATKPDGIIFSPGPGDPVRLDRLVECAQGLVNHLPVMGICLGHQILGRAFGAKTYKLKFGHHGANHPVKDLESGAVHITTQNHGYAIDAEGLRDGAEPSHVNLNDGTCEGLRHRDLPIVSIQYHSEAGPGPRDNEYLFDRFLSFVEEQRG
jgi:carbamoyl-phosphate synthase small subunit